MSLTRPADARPVVSDFCLYSAWFLSRTDSPLRGTMDNASVSSGSSSTSGDELSAVLSRRQKINEALEDGKPVPPQFSRRPSAKNVFLEFKEFSRKQINEYETTFKKCVLNDWLFRLRHRRGEEEGGGGVFVAETQQKNKIKTARKNRLENKFPFRCIVLLFLSFTNVFPRVVPNRIRMCVCIYIDTVFHRFPRIRRK